LKWLNGKRAKNTVATDLFVSLSITMFYSLFTRSTNWTNSGLKWHD